MLYKCGFLFWIIMSCCFGRFFWSFNFWFLVDRNFGMGIKSSRCSSNFIIMI